MHTEPSSSNQSTIDLVYATLHASTESQLFTVLFGKRKSKRAAREQCEAEWKLIKEEHERATEAWKLECERLKSDGVRPKDLPTKPKRPAKPKPVVEDEEDDDEDNSSDEEGM